jgi:DNA primase
MVSPEKHIWHDFSSNKGGDIFSFIMEVEGIDFRQALELLARKAGVDLSQYEQRTDRGLGQKKELLYGLLHLAANFYQHSLISNQAALEYVFKKRRLSKAVVQQFRIGYAPNAEDGLVKFLLKRGYKDSDIRDAGLLVMRRGRPGDMFRQRMMVPLADGQGRIVGFTARLIADQPNAPKYINTPQTLLYDKGRQVFGLHLAKEAIRKHDRAVIVEGNLDVVASHQAGVAEVVATAGTAMTEYHLKDLSRLTGNIRLAFDSDRAGIAATERAISIASKLGLRLSIVSVPEGFKDPDELIQAAPEQWAQVIAQPQDAIEWLIGQYAKRFNLATAEGKSRTTTAALDIIRSLRDPVEQEHYITVIAEHTSAGVAAVKAKFEQADSAPTRPLKMPKVQRTTSHSTAYLYQDYLLALLLVYPGLRSELHSLAADYFAGGLRQTIFQLVSKLGDKQLSSVMLEKLQSDELCVKIKELQLIVEQRFPQQPEALKAQAHELAKRVIIESKIKQKNNLAKDLAEASDPADRQNKNEAYKKLLQEIEHLRAGKE